STTAGHTGGAQSSCRYGETPPRESLANSPSDTTRPHSDRGRTAHHTEAITGTTRRVAATRGRTLWKVCGSSSAWVPRWAERGQAETSATSLLGPTRAFRGRGELYQQSEGRERRVSLCQDSTISFRERA